MRKRLVAGISVIGILAGGAGAAIAAPGPNGHNTFGLCTAYAHNDEHAKKAPPFAGLEAAAAAANQTVAQYCAANGQHPGRGGGRG